MAERIVCPEHGIPDCSPLLNGCGLVNRMRTDQNDVAEPLSDETLAATRSMALHDTQSQYHLTRVQAKRVLDLLDEHERLKKAIERVTDDNMAERIKQVPVTWTRRMSDGHLSTGDRSADEIAAEMLALIRAVAADEQEAPRDRT